MNVCINITFVIIFGVAFLYLLLANYLSLQYTPQTASRTFLLGIQVTFNNLDAKLKFTKLFKEFSVYVKKNEKGTLQYKLYESDKDDNLIFLVEEYQSKYDYTEIHRKSPTFIAFREELSKLSSGYTMNGHSYYLSP